MDGYVKSWVSSQVMIAIIKVMVPISINMLHALFCADQLVDQRAASGGYAELGVRSGVAGRHTVQACGSTYRC